MATVAMSLSIRSLPFNLTLARGKKETREAIGKRVRGYSQGGKENRGGRGGKGRGEPQGGK